VPSRPTVCDLLPDTGKSWDLPEIDELVDHYWHRRLAAWAVRAVQNTGITPNQVTILSGVTGALSGVVMIIGWDRPLVRLVAAVLALVSVVLDCVDGQLARARGESSTAGMILDGLVDIAAGFFVLLGMTWIIWRTTEQVWVWPLAAFAMLSSLAHCFVFDTVKRRYIRHVRGDAGRFCQSAPIAIPADVPPGFYTWVYRRHMRAQRTLIPDLIGFSPQRYRAENRDRIRLWALLGLGTHIFVLYTAIALSVIWPGALVGCLLFVAVPMNVLFGWLLVGEFRRARTVAYPG
jgi:phosphatidylglycerophosphate synthase